FFPFGAGAKFFSQTGGVPVFTHHQGGVGFELIRVGFSLKDDAKRLPDDGGGGFATSLERLLLLLGQLPLFLEARLGILPLLLRSRQGVLPLSFRALLGLML